MLGGQSVGLRKNLHVNFSKRLRHTHPSSPSLASSHSLSLDCQSQIKLNSQLSISEQCILTHMTIPLQGLPVMQLSFPKDLPDVQPVSPRSRDPMRKNEKRKL